MKEEVRQKVMERFSISEQAMQLLLESAEMMSFVPKDIIVHCLLYTSDAADE